MNKKRIIIMSFLDLWSMEDGKGAPSFYNTVKAYVDADWETILIQPKSKYRCDYKLEGCKFVKFDNNLLDRINKIPKVRFFIRSILLRKITKDFYREASKLLDDSTENTILYAYEIHAVKASKKLAVKYNVPFITRFQGTILTTKSNTIFNRILKYPHFGALKEKSDLVIMTDDGTKGDEVLARVKNTTEKILFYKNGQNEMKSITEIKDARIKLRKHLNISDDETVLLTVSRLKNWKRVDRSIKATKELKNQGYKIKLVVVGDGEEYSNLKELSHNLNTEDNVVFIGSVKQNDVWKYYSMSDIFLSLYDLSNVGNPLMEALKYGKAIVTINNGDTSTLITNNENGILLEEHEIEKAPFYIKTIIENKCLKKKLEKNSATYASINLWPWGTRMDAEIKEVAKLIDQGEDNEE